jgi:hypothetical protein
MCYCIKGFRKCVVNKCAPFIRGCIPRLPREGSCCPTSYDCSRSLKVTRQIQQHDDDEQEEETDTDSIDFFSLLFGSDEPPEEERTETLPPFKALPTTEKSFFDFIRAGLEIIDANADKIDSSINDVVTTPKDDLKDKSAGSNETTQSSTVKRVETTTQQTRPKTTATTRKVTTSTAKLVPTTKLPPSSAQSTKLPSTTLKTTTAKSSGITAAKSSSKAGMKYGLELN